MSAVRYFDRVPHIVRYGMHDEKDEKCWIKFWRNGVRFTINVRKEDVQGTDFYSQWKPLLRESSRHELSLSDWVEQQWHPLCDLLITTSMPMLRQLAPDQDYWVTLRDYLHTPAYQLKLIATEDQRRVEAMVEAGPTDTGAYNFEPVSSSKLPLPVKLPYYQSSQLTVIGKEKDWRQTPAKVSLPDGRMLFFLGCEMGTRNSRTEQITNSSLDAICAKLKMYELEARSTSGAKWPGALPRVCGLVVDHPLVKDASGTLQEEMQRESVAKSEQRIAGILLTWIPHGKTLRQIIQQSTAPQTSDLLKRSVNWRKQIIEALVCLHQNAVFFGGREDWPFINQFSVLIGDGEQVWLDSSHVSSTDDIDSEEARAGMTMDTQACVRLFDDWLPGELAKKPEG